MAHFAFGRLLLHYCLGLVQVRGQLRFRSVGSCVASGILLQFRRAPLHVLVILLYSAFFVLWLVYRVLLGFSFPPFLPGSVSLLFFGIGVSVGDWLGLVLCPIYLLFLH